MLSTLKKDKNCRTLVKKFEIKKLYAKVFQQDLLLKYTLEKESINFLSSLQKDRKSNINKINSVDVKQIPYNFSLESFLYDKAIK